jgi:hypothetical protein
LEVFRDILSHRFCVTPKYWHEETKMDENLRPEEQPSEKPRPEELRPEELRSAARYVEATARPALAHFSTIPIPRYSGSPTGFPQASEADQAAEDGVDDLRQVIGQTVRAIYTVAFLRENGITVPPVLWLPVEPYIVAYLDHERTNRERTNQDQTR